MLYSLSDRDPESREPGISVSRPETLERLKERLFEHFGGPELAGSGRLWAAGKRPAEALATRWLTP